MYTLNVSIFKVLFLVWPVKKVNIIILQKYYLRYNVTNTKIIDVEFWQVSGLKTYRTLIAAIETTNSLKLIK